MRRVQAVSDVGSGGQVILDTETFSKINSKLDELGLILSKAVPVKDSKKQDSACFWSKKQKNETENSMESKVGEDGK